MRPTHPPFSKGGLSLRPDIFSSSAFHLLSISPAHRRQKGGRMAVRGEQDYERKPTSRPFQPSWFRSTTSAPADRTERRLPPPLKYLTFKKNLSSVRIKTTIKRTVPINSKPYITGSNIAESPTCHVFYVRRIRPHEGKSRAVPRRNRPCERKLPVSSGTIIFKQTTCHIDILFILLYISIR